MDKLLWDAMAASAITITMEDFFSTFLTVEVLFIFLNLIPSLHTANSLIPRSIPKPSLFVLDIFIPVFELDILYLYYY